MSSDDIAIVGAALAVAGAVITLVGVNGGRRHKQRKQRLDILQTALQRPDLDAPTRREIMRVLTEEHAAHGLLAMLFKPALWLRLWFAAGWLLFFFGGGLWLLDVVGAMRDVPRDVVVPMMLAGLAMMTLPLGLRELLRRERGLADAG